MSLPTERIVTIHLPAHPNKVARLLTQIHETWQQETTTGGYGRAKQKTPVLDLATDDDSTTLVVRWQEIP